MKRFAKTTRGNVLSKHTISNNNFIQCKAVYRVLSLNIHFPFCKLKNYLLLFYKIQLPRHDSVDEIAAFDIWAVPCPLRLEFAECQIFSVLPSMWRNFKSSKAVYLYRYLPMYWYVLIIPISNNTLFRLVHWMIGLFKSLLMYYDQDFCEYSFYTRMRPSW